MRRSRRLILSVLMLLGALILVSLVFVTGTVLSDWTDWNYRAGLEVRNNATTPLPNGYTVSWELDTADLIGQGWMQSDCADLRVAYGEAPTEVELDRLVEDCDTASTTVTFRTQAEIAVGAADSNYRIYYGNALAVDPPADPANVLAFYDDFEDGDAADWTPAKGTWLVVNDGSNHFYRYTDGGANWALSYVSLADVSDLDYLVRIRATDSPMTNWIGSAFRIQDPDNFMTFYQSRDTDEFKLAQIATDSHSILQHPYFDMAADTWYWLRLQAIGDQLRARIWASADPEPTSWNIQATVTSYETETDIGATLHYHATEADWDDVQVRRLVDIEPSVNLTSVPWWDTAWGYRTTVTVTNESGTDVLPIGYSVAVSLDTSTLIAAGQMLGSCDDLRVVSPDGLSSTELDRIVEGCGTTDTQVWLALDQSLSPSGIDASYYLYYGNPLAGAPPADGMNVFVFFEDWEQGTTHWTSAGSWDPSNTGTMGTSEISTLEAFSPSHSQEFPLQASGGDAFSGYIPVTPGGQYAIGVWGKSATSAYAPVGFDPYDSSYTQGSEVWLWTNEWTVPSTWAPRSASFTTGATTAYLKIKSEWWSAGPGTEPVYFDNLFLRYAMTDEPTVAVGDEETILPVPVIVSVEDTGPVEVGTPILVTAVVSSTEGTIDTVTLNVQSPETGDVAMSLVVGDDEYGTWEGSYTPAEGGPYTYRVLATASTGRSRLSAVHSFDVTDAVSPDIALVSITDPILVRDTQILTVTITDNGRVNEVTVEVDGNIHLMTQHGDQYDTAWRVNTVGTISYTVRATDTVGNSSSLVGDFESQAREVDVCLWKDCKSGAASFSVDDGNNSCRTELENAGFRGTYYYNGSTTPDPNWLATYSAAGHEIGSHSVSHPCDTPCCTPNCTPEALWDCEYTPAEVAAYREDQIEPNIAAIKAGTGIPVVSMAWPCGCADARRMTAASYYFLGVRGYYDHIAQLEWVEDVNEPTPDEFMNLNSGNDYDQALIDRAITEGKWAIITSHGSCTGITYMGQQSANLWLAPVGTVLEYIYVRDAASFSNYDRYGRTISFDAVHTLDPFVRQEVDGTPMFTIYFDDPVTLMVHVLDSDEVLGVEVDDTPVSYSLEMVAGTQYVLFDTQLDATKHVSVTLAQPAPTIVEVTDSGVTELGDSSYVTATVTIEDGIVQGVTLEIVSPESASYPMALVPGTTDTYEAEFIPSQLVNHTYRVLASNDEGRTSQSELRTLVVQDTTAPMWQGQSQSRETLPTDQSNTLTAETMDIGGLDWAILATNESGTWQEFTWPTTDWWDHEWPHRRPVTVTEVTGLARSFETADLLVTEAEYPGLVDCAAELRVTDQNHQEIPVQVYDERMEAGVLTCRLLFQASVEANADRTYYIYYGNPSAVPPSYTTDLSSSTGSGAVTAQNSFFDLDLDTDGGVISRMRLPAGSNSNLPLSPETDDYWGWHQVCSSVHGNITGKDQLCNGGTAPATGLAIANTLDGPIVKEYVLTNIKDTAIYSMTFRFLANAPYYQYDLVRTGTTASVMNNFWYANGNFGRLGAGSGGSPATVHNTYSYATDEARLASFAAVDYGIIDGTDNDGTDLGGTNYETPTASALSLYVTTGPTQAETEEVLAKLHSPLTVEYGEVEDAPTGQYGSPMTLDGATTWTQTDFAWQNPSIPVGTVVQWYIKYCDASGNCISTDVESFELEEPTAVTLGSFTAEPGVGHITLVWETTTEIDNVGFNIYRSDAPDGEYARLNGELIPSQAPGSPADAAYSWEDVEVELGRTYYYKLEAVDIHGGRTVYGPVSATLPARATLSVYLPLVTR